MSLLYIFSSARDTSKVNMVCTKVKGEPIYEIVKPIPMHHEIIVYYLPERPEELFFSRMRNTFYRQTMDSILEGEYRGLLFIVDFPKMNSTATAWIECDMLITLCKSAYSRIFLKIVVSTFVASRSQWQNVLSTSGNQARRKKFKSVAH